VVKSNKKIAASRQAQLLVKMKKEKIDDQVNVLERRAANPGGIIRELVASFLIPNVQREKLQKRGKDLGSRGND